ncbi:MAG TPA: YCF48-related protein [Edaphobacter sp.]
MTDILHRYPGAQPFRDDEVSRRTFFGREQASVALTDQILANRLVIVYAKSGLGKTSLLNAGVAPRLREAGSLPLLVRANDIQHGPLFSVLEGIRGEAKRQQIEYVEGDSSSLWSFFKSAEFWRGDLLLTPVLILDQFEELFTLQSPEARETFLSDLGYLVRGIPPPSQPKLEVNASDTPPAIRVVLSLREDFLGMVEEASDRIPEIMDHRFRVTPLSYEMATKAITGPAAIEDRDIVTRAFRLEPEFVTSILTYLTKSTAGAHGPAGRYVEPFHLQLICQRIEKVVAFKQQVSSEEVVLNFNDLGGEAALAETLESFYLAAIQSLPARHLRGAARILCEQFLISPEGRRLSVEERELRRQLKLPRETLSHLVERRLLRTDRRSDSTYYELSHDALVQPVLASRRMQAMVVSWASVLAGSIVVFMAGSIVLFCVVGGIATFVDKSTRMSIFEYFWVLCFAVLAWFLGMFGVAWLRAGLRRRMRYRPHTESEFTRSLPTLLPLGQRLLGWSMLLAGPALFIVWGLRGLFDLVIYGTGSFTHGKAPHWLAWAKEDVHQAWQLMYDHPFVEMVWTVLEYSAIVIFGWLLLRMGARKLWPHKFTVRPKVAAVPGVDQPPSLALASLKALFGGIGLIGSVLGFFTLRTCVSLWHGNVPHWLNVTIVSYRLSDACQAFYQKSWNWNGISFGLFFFCTFIFSIALLRTGILDVRTALRHRQLAPLQPKYKWATSAGVACGALILAALVYWAWPRSSIGHDGRGQKLAQGTMANRRSGTPASGWAVGNNATILHTEDGGGTWESQSRGTGWLYSVTFPTAQSGWTVGQHGTIWHTEDGGGTWKVQNSATTADLVVVAFTQPQSGWTVGGDGVILHTEDGNTWKSQDSGTHERLHAVAFPASQSGWAVGANGVILHTEDGSTWKAQNSGTSEDLYDASFATPQSGWAIGADGIILHTDNGGATWKLQDSGTVRDLSGIAFATPLSVWVVGDKGTILHTENGGGTWRHESSGTRANLIEIAFVTQHSGWAVGQGGIVLHTEDDGETWIQQSSGTSANLQAVAFAKPHGIIGIELPRGSTPPAEARVLHVTPDGPAYKAGLKSGDVIVSVNGKPVKNGDELVTMISAMEPGTDVTLVYIRNGKNETTNLTVTDSSKPFANRADGNVGGPESLKAHPSRK